MTYTNHNEEKEALQQALNHTAIYRGIQLCTVAITRADDWITHDDGSITGPGYTTAVAPSAEVKALIDASLDPAPPIGPPPAPPADTPADPPPNDLPASPVAAFTVEYLPGRKVTVKDASQDVPDGSVMKMDFGNQAGGTIRYHNTISNRYAVGGDYTLTETIRTAAGEILSTAQQTITVADDGTVPPGTPPPPAPAPGPPAQSIPDGLPLFVEPQTENGSVVLVGKLDDGTIVNVTAGKGQRVPIIAGNPNAGSLVFYADGLCARIEDGYYTTTGDLSGTFTLTHGDMVLFDGPLTVWARTGATFWITQPAVNPDADLSMFPEYGSDTAASMYDKFMAANNYPMSRSLWPIATDHTGEGPDLGPLDQYSAIYKVTKAAKDAAVVLGLADAAGAFPFLSIDPATNKMVSTVGNPKISLDRGVAGQYGNLVPKITSACPQSLSQAAAHAPTLYAMAAAITDADYYKEGLAMWANYVGSLDRSWTVPGRLPSGMTDARYGQTRGKGRALTTILYASKLSDNPDYFDRWVEEFAVSAEATWTTQVGVQIDQYDIPYFGGRGYAQWQEWILIDALGRALDFGHAGYQKTFDYFATNLLDSILNSQHEFSTLSHWYAKDDTGAMLADWNAVLAYTATQDTLGEGYNLPAAVGLPEDSAELMAALYPGSTLYKAGDFANSPTSPTGYVAQMRMAVVAVFKHATDRPRSEAAMALYTERERVDYKDNLKYNIIPSKPV